MKPKTKAKPRKKSVSQAVCFCGSPLISVKRAGRKAEVVQGRYAWMANNAEDAVKDGVLQDSIRLPLVRRERINPIGIEILHASVSPSKRRIPRCKSHKQIKWVEPVFVHHGCSLPNDPKLPVQWALDAIGGEGIWTNWHGDPQAVLLAVLDTGVPLEQGQLSHADFNRDQIRLATDWINHDLDPADDHGHGTHVLGIASAATNNGTGITGIWPGRVLVSKTSDAKNRGTDETFLRGIVEAVDLARQLNVRLVINYSSIGPDTLKNREAVKYAHEAGALLVAAAGNTYGTVQYPAAYSTKHDSVIAVGAVDDQRRRAPFSSRGAALTLVAPGTNILSTLPNYCVTLTVSGKQPKQPKYDVLSGTSQATALTSAVASLVWSQWPELSAQEVRNKLASTATPLGPSKDFGSGLLNAPAALA